MTQPHPDQRPLSFVPFGEDPLAVLAQRLLDEQQAQLPRLTQCVILIPDPQAAPRLRQLLLEGAAARGYEALLGPRILTLKEWLGESPLESPAPLLGDYQRELILTEALRAHRDLFGEANLWALGDTLLNLFDELSLNHVDLPATLEEFSHRVAEAYGLGGKQLTAMDREAKLVHTLWQAWGEQLRGRNAIDRNSRYLLQLVQSLQHLPLEHIYMAGLPTLRRAERQWLQKMIAAGHLTLILHGVPSGEPPRRYHPQTPIYRLCSELHCTDAITIEPSPAGALFDAIYTPDETAAVTLRDRAAYFAAAHPHSPVAGKLTILSAEGDEEEARAVELQVRRWLHEGKRRVAIVTENRRLARRVRALLERSGIVLQDAAGWALSTTSAAAVMERWLQCIEEDFPHLAMLDLLKSPFAFADRDREAHLATVYRLEQDIVLHENIGSGLARYRRHTASRQHRLPTELGTRLDEVQTLLAQLEEAATPLCQLHKEISPAHHYLEALTASLGPLGLTESLSQDPAGARLLDELAQMHAAVIAEPVTMSWLEFRGWLGRALERYHFRPPTSAQTVTLMGLGQTQLARLDALVIAGVEREFLPGTPPTSPFFNDAVRRELGLDCGEMHLAERFYNFRRLLEAAPRLLLTLRHQQDGEEVIPSPWLESLRTFHTLAYDDDLEAWQLALHMRDPACEVVNREKPLPAPRVPPAVSAPASMLPVQYSASSYQQLMDCPYQFYAARILRLSPPDTIREALEKSDYGERVHRCLQAFHGDVGGLPGPFRGQLILSRRDEAIALLEAISRAVFAADLEDNFLHRGWLQRWQEKIPHYIDWQIAREQEWRPAEVECDITGRSIGKGLTLTGRLDRIDAQGKERSIVDYKTGRTADRETVLSGEAIQLPFYQLLHQSTETTVTRVEYLALDEKKITSRSELEGDELEQLSLRVGARLLQLQQQMSEGQALPAWGDEISCGRCRMQGLCRRGTWLEQ